MSFWTRPRKVATGVGATLAVAGIAFAAVTLSTEIGGSTAIADSSASFTVQSVTASGQTGGIKCTGSTNSGHTMVLDAVAKRFNGQIAAQGCDVTATVANTGDTSIAITNAQFNTGQAALQGWTITPQSADPSVPAHGTATFKAHVSTGGSGVTTVGTGSFTGTLVGTADDGA